MTIIMKVTLLKNTLITTIMLFNYLKRRCWSIDTSVASFWVLGGGGARPPNVPTKIIYVFILRERAPQKHIFSGLKIHLHTMSYTVNAVSFNYLWSEASILGGGGGGKHIVLPPPPKILTFLTFAPPPPPNPKNGSTTLLMVWRYIHDIILTRH